MDTVALGGWLQGLLVGEAGGEPGGGVVAGGGGYSQAGKGVHAGVVFEGVFGVHGLAVGVVIAAAVFKESPGIKDDPKKDKTKIKNKTFLVIAIYAK